MTAVNLKTLLNKANKHNYAVAGLVVLTWEDAIAYTEAADKTGIPIILQAGPSCREFTPVSILGGLSQRSLVQYFNLNMLTKLKPFLASKI